MHDCLIIGIAGPSGSGKSTLCRSLQRRIGYDICTTIEMDHYYRDQGHLSPAARDALDYDAPEMVEMDLLVEHLRALAAGASVRVPRYEFATHTRTGFGRLAAPSPVVLVEGLFCLTSLELRECLDWSVFVATDDSACLARRLSRDVAARARTPEQVYTQYRTHVRPAAERHVLPSVFHARRVVMGTRPPDELCDEILADLSALVPECRFWPRRAPDALAAPRAP